MAVRPGSAPITMPPKRRPQDVDQRFESGKADKGVEHDSSPSGKPDEEDAFEQRRDEQAGDQDGQADRDHADGSGRPVTRQLRNRAAKTSVNPPETRRKSSRPTSATATSIKARVPTIRPAPSDDAAGRLGGVPPHGADGKDQAAEEKRDTDDAGKYPRRRQWVDVPVGESRHARRNDDDGKAQERRSPLPSRGPP